MHLIIRTIIIILLVISQVLFCFSQKNKVKPNGYNVFYYGDGTISSEGLMKNGKPTGFWKTYHVNGKIKSYGNRKNFKLDSIWVFFDEKGDTIQKISYENGIKNGYSISYHIPKDRTEYNSVSKIQLYVDGLREGNTYYYYPNRNTWKIIPYENDLKSGDGFEYSEDNIITSLLKFRNDYLVEREKINRRDKNGWKQGVWKSFFYNGKLSRDIEYLNDTLHGHYRVYSSLGRLLVNKKYIHGKLYEELLKETKNTQKQIDVKISNYADGTVRSRGSYIGKIPVGLHQEFSREGKVVSAVEYDQFGNRVGEGIFDVEAKRQGMWKIYYPTGELRAEGKYENNQRIGVWKFYYKNKKLEQKGVYRKGLFTGDWTWYYENGSILRTEQYDDGLRNGNYVEYYEDSTLLAKGAYTNDMKTGYWEYYEGDEKEEGEYSKDLKTGMWKRYYSNGKIKQKGKYSRGYLDGKHKYYYKSGKINEEINYVTGKRHKLYRKFDEEGNVELTLTYRRGELVKIDGARVRKE